MFFYSTDETIREDWIANELFLGSTPRYLPSRANSYTTQLKLTSQLKLSQHSRQRPSSMTESEFCVQIDFSHGVLELRKIEKRIVAKAIGPAWCLQDDALDGTVRGVLNPAIARGDKYTVVSGVSLLCGQISQPLQQNHVVPDVGIVVRVRRVHEACICRKAS